jgi:5-methylcytosine-specific restriction endonuclease McrA
MSAGLTLKQHLAQQGLLQRFEERAIRWAEEAQIRWIELEGELWTLVSELERKKGVEPGDFTTHAKPAQITKALLEKGGEPPAALQRLIQVPGVRRASIPTAFDVESGYALSCGGPGAKAGITALVRQQMPEWALAGYTLVNVPLALSYLMHGRTKVAKATRNLTIGTTVDVGRAAAARQDAPLATLPFADGISPQMSALLAQMMQLVAAEQAQTAQVAYRADAKADRALQTVDQLSASIKKRDKLSKPVRRKVKELWETYFRNECPCCHKPVSGEQGTMEVDHFWNDSDDLTNLWFVCKACNHRMGKPGPHRSAQDKTRHTTWLDRCGLQALQRNLFFDCN